MKIKLTALLLALCLAFPLLLGGCLGEVEQTNESLTIYADKYVPQYMLESAVSAFRIDYPDIPFSIYDPAGGDDSMTEEQIQTKISTELMSGSGGADLFLLSCAYGGQGSYAPIKSGVFCDLNPFLESDPDYHPEEYHQDILDAGIYRGKRFVMPLDYFQFSLLSSESVLKEAGIDVSRCATAEGFREEMMQYLSRPDSVPLWVPMPEGLIADLMPGLVDREAEETHLLEEKYRPWHEFLAAEWKKEQEHGFDPSFGACEGIEMGEYLFIPEQNPPLEHLDFLDDSVMLPSWNAEGTQTANVATYAGIRNTSPNQENAYRFLRYLIGAEAQTNHLYNALPVLKGAEKAIEMEYRQWIGQRRWQYNYKGERVEEQVRTARPQYFYDSMWEMLLTNPRTVCFDDREWAKQVYSYMRPFYEGTASYEDCAQKAQEQMETYLSQ